VIINDETQETTDITSSLIAANMRWQATSVGNYTIAGYAISNAGYNISDAVTVTVLHGVAVSVASTVDTFAQDAGKEISILITGTDADGNTFPQTVEWTENNSGVDDMSAGTDEGVMPISLERPALIHLSSARVKPLAALNSQWPLNLRSVPSSWCFLKPPLTN
jgi:hypothetical protein